MSVRNRPPEEDTPETNPKFYYFMAGSPASASWCYRISMNGVMPVSIIKKSGQIWLHIFTLFSWIVKPSFNSYKSHRTWSTAGCCCVRSYL